MSYRHFKSYTLQELTVKVRYVILKIQLEIITKCYTEQKLESFFTGMD